MASIKQNSVEKNWAFRDEWERNGWRRGNLLVYPALWTVRGTVALDMWLLWCWIWALVTLLAESFPGSPRLWKSKNENQSYGQYKVKNMSQLQLHTIIRIIWGCKGLTSPLIWRELVSTHAHSVGTASSQLTSFYRIIFNVSANCHHQDAIWSGSLPRSSYIH